MLLCWCALEDEFPAKERFLASMSVSEDFWGGSTIVEVIVVFFLPSMWATNDEAGSRVGWWRKDMLAASGIIGNGIQWRDPYPGHSVMSSRLGPLGAGWHPHPSGMSILNLQASNPICRFGILAGNACEWLASWAGIDLLIYATHSVNSP